MTSQVQQLFDLACMFSEDDRRELVTASLESLTTGHSRESDSIPWDEVEKRIEQ